MEGAINFIADWLNSASYPFFTDMMAKGIELATLAYLKFLIWVIPFAWGIAKTIIQDLGVNDALTAAWSQLDSKSLQMLAFFQVPTAVNHIVTALVTKVALRFIPGV